jgi:GT2 family glycosyltransferase
VVIKVPLGDDRVDVSVVSWNSWTDLRQNLPALITQDYPSYRVVVVDNASGDASADEVESNFPDVTVLRNDRNAGFGAANNRCFARSDSKYVAAVNPDARPEPGWLRALVAALEANPHAALATSKVLLASDAGRVNACGTAVHISGISSCRGLGDDQHEYVAQTPVAAVSGAAFVARRDVLEQIGGFDERFFMYMEDIELSLRARLAGYDVVLAPRSRVLHDYELHVPAWKFYYLERNRFLLLANIFRVRTLIALAPALVVAEAGVWWFALRSGPRTALAKLRAYAAVALTLRAVLRNRRRVQAVRRVPDRALLDVMDSALPRALGAQPPPVMGIADRFFGMYAAALRHVVRW